jgi:hypothetical protein
MLFLPLLLLVDLLVAHPIRLAHRTVASGQRAKRAAHDADLEAGVYVLQFKQRIDTVGLRRVVNVLGYEPTDYVPKHGLMLYINSSAQALALQQALDTRMARLFKLIASDRQSNIGSQLHKGGGKKSRTGGLVIYRNQSITGQPIVERAPKDPSLVVLRAHIIGLSLEDIRFVIDIEAIEQSIIPASRTRPTIKFPNNEVMIIRNVHRDDASAVADALVRIYPYVAWVEMRQPYRLMNRWSVPSIQKRTASLVARDVNFQPVGTGKGQIVSISDTGVATTQCFFTDGLGARVGTVPRTTGSTTVPADTKHPKFRAYTSGVGGDYDDANGHGTHTTGTLAGRAAASSPMSPYNGVAADARICFYDVDGPQDDDSLAIPDNVADIFQWSQNCGAYVHSASWGADSFGAYDQDARNTDMFLRKNRFFLPVFAVGNTGPSRGTAGSPGVAKNVLTVGAVMNGIAAIEMAIRRAPYAAAVYNNTRVADFSSRGDFDARSAAKVDVVADGGAYVWSAAFDAPKSGSCNTSECIMGLEGSSMATPGIGGAVVLTREWLMANAKLETMPTGSLMRAMLVAAAIPTDGPYPSTKPYASYSDRRNAEGFGRVVLDQILGTNLKIVSNERGQYGLARAGDVLRLCVAIEGQSPLTGVLADGTEMVITMSYVDYPSSVGLSQADLVNDLDLVVRTATNSTPLSVNGLPPGTKETISTNERVILKSPRAVDISVVASTVDFDGPQTFSLLFALRGPNAARYKLVVSTPQLLHGESQSPCSLCGSTQFVAKSDCIVCGDGVVNAPSEQCEPSLSGAECCDTRLCTWLSRNTLCATQVGGCLAQGRCTPDGPAANASVSCTPSAQLAYRMKRTVDHATGQTATLCDSINIGAIVGQLNISQLADAVAVCGHSVAYWVAQLRAHPETYTNDDDRLCCARFTAYAEERAPAEPLYQQLALEFIATRLNAEQHVTSEQLVALRAAQLLLEKQCGTSAFTTSQDREDAQELIQRLETLALPVCANESAVPPDRCQPMVRATEVSELLCNGPPNRYIDNERRCACGAMYHIGEPDCRNLACGGNGVSIYDYQTNQPQCVCLPGWTGVSCNRCADAPAGARYLCIGVPNSLVVTQHTHVLQMVDAASVMARIDGSYYPSNVPKQNDALPGAAPLDCACRRQANRITSANFETHIETVEASLDEINEQTALWAHANVLLQPSRSSAAMPFPAQRLTSDAEPRRVTSAAYRLEMLSLTTISLILGLMK